MSPLVSRWQIISHMVPPKREQVFRVFHAIVYGVINAILCIPCMWGYGAIIFRDPVFAPYRPQLVKLLLWSCVVHQVVFSLKSSLPYAIGQVCYVTKRTSARLATATVHCIPI